MDARPDCGCPPGATFHALNCPKWPGAKQDQDHTVKVSRIDIEAIESLSDATIRSGDTQTAIEGYALALRLRSETGFHPKRRSTDAVT